MPAYSKTSSKRLSTCHQDLQTLFNEVIKYFDCTILCGHRGETEQNLAYEQGNSQLKYPESKHNKTPSLAVDAVPYPINWADTDRMKFFIGFVLGIAARLKEEGKISHDIISGIDWDSDTELMDTNFMDHPHYELK